MEMRRLGNDGPMVSVLGLGTVKIGRNTGLRYAAGFSLPTDAQVRELLETAREVGINLIDTAPAYGSSEERLGAIIGAVPGGWDGWVVCTKVGEEFDGDRSRHDFSPGAVRASVERSLRRLRVERVDVVLIHSDGRDVEIVERSGAVEELERLRAAGLVGRIGMSTKTVEGALAAVERMDVVMVTLNEKETADLPAIARARELGKGVVVKKALGQGSSVGSLGFAVRTAGVSSVVVGTVDAGHLRENVRVVGAERH
jgi:aryl-alcohol dehydrogenase-like predicted oxidoreductase